MRQERVKHLLDEFTTWASARADVKGVALVGSYARSQAREDLDVDLVLLTTQPRDYLDDATWAARFGEVSGQRLEEYGALTSVRVRYADGLDVEYGITGDDWAALPLDEGSRQVISDGIVVLFERGDLLSRHLPVKPSHNP